MNYALLIPLLVTTFVAVTSWYVAHRLSVSRDRANKRRELRVKFLIDAYRQLEGVSNRPVTAQTASGFESAIADIQLFGTPRQVELAQAFAVNFAAQGSSPLDPLLADLRQDLRLELDLQEVPAKVKFLRITFDDDRPVVRFSGGAEQQLRDLAEEMRAIEEAPPAAKVPLDWKKYMDEYVRILSSPAAPQEKLVSAAILLERVIYEAGNAAGLNLAPPKARPQDVVHELAQMNLVTARERLLFLALWKLRNSLVHGQITSATEAQVVKLLDLTWRLIRRFA